MQSRWDSPWIPPFRQDPNPNMRVGDAERNQMSEILSKHYSDGRLDAAEFQERLDRAMNAKTRADLSGLLADLPPLANPDQKPVPPPPRHRHGLLRTVILVLFAVWAFSFVGAGVHLWWIHIPWLLVILVVALLWGRERSHHRRGY